MKTKIMRVSLAAILLITPVFAKASALGCALAIISHAATEVTTVAACLTPEPAEPVICTIEIGQLGLSYYAMMDACSNTPPPPPPPPPPPSVTDDTTMTEDDLGNYGDDFSGYEGEEDACNYE